MIPGREVRDSKVNEVNTDFPRLKGAIDDFGMCFPDCRAHFVHPKQWADRRRSARDKSAISTAKPGCEYS